MTQNDELPRNESINEPRGSSVVPGSGEDKPTITALDPDRCAIGGPDFTLDVTGNNFSDVSIIFFAGHDEPTTHNEDGTLSTGVKPSLWGSPVVVQCQIRNGSVFSDPVDFTFEAAGGTRDADQDELEEELDEAIEAGDAKPTHKKKKR